MLPPETQKALNDVVGMTAFQAIFAEIRTADPKIGPGIESALRNQLAETHKAVAEAGDDRGKLQFALYREAVELKAHVASFLRYSDTMAQREAALWKFALDVTTAFFEQIYAALESYFHFARTVMEGEIEKSATWYSGLQDSAKKAGTLANLAKKGLAKVANKVADAGWNEAEVVDSRTQVEKLLQTHLSPQTLQADVTGIMEEAAKKYQEAWKKHLEANAPDVRDIASFAAPGSELADLKIRFEMGAPEQALLVGVGGAVVATIGLAAGWHTITYALLSVFPPAALFAVFATVVLAIWKKDEAKERRKRIVADAVNEYYRRFMMHIETAKIDTLAQKTLRAAMQDQARTLVGNVMARWAAAISGSLTVDHYRRLSAAATAHLATIDECLTALKA